MLFSHFFLFVFFHHLAPHRVAGSQAVIAGKQGQIPCPVFQHPVFFFRVHDIGCHYGVLEFVSVRIVELDLASDRQGSDSAEMALVVVAGDNEVFLVKGTGIAAGGDLQFFIVSVFHDRQ